MSNKISKRGAIQFLLIYLLLLWHDSGLKWMLGKTNFDYFCLGISLLFWAIYIKKRIANLELWLILLGINIVMVRLMNFGGVGLSYLLHAYSALTLVYFAYLIDKERFVQRYIKVLSFFALTSLLIWASTLVDPNLYERFTVFSYVPYFKRIWSSDVNYTLQAVTYKGVLLYVERIGNELTRNNGIFNEPGLYEMVLNIGVYLLLFYSELCGDNPKKNRKLVFLFIVCILSTQSTTGYFSLIAILIVFILSKNRNEKSTKRSIILIIGMMVAMLAFDSLTNGSTSIIAKVFGAKVKIVNGHLQFIGTGENRLSTWGAVLLCLGKNPLGTGFDTLYTYLGLIGKTSTDGAAIISTLGALGIQLWLILFICYVRPVYKYSKSKALFVLSIFIYINTTFGQSDIFYPSLLIMMLPLAHRQTQGEMYENTMDVQYKNQ